MYLKLSTHFFGDFSKERQIITRCPIFPWGKSLNKHHQLRTTRPKCTVIDVFFIQVTFHIIWKNWNGNYAALSLICFLHILNSRAPRYKLIYFPKFILNSALSNVTMTVKAHRQFPCNMSWLIPFNILRRYPQNMYILYKSLIMPNIIR